jgi:hypothetical protein
LVPNCHPCMGSNCEENCTCITDNTMNCNKTDGMCNCKTGWEDSNCETDINECLNSNICQDNSQCQNTNGSCIVSYTGTILFTIWSPIAFHTCYKIIHKSSQLCTHSSLIRSKKKSLTNFITNVVSSTPCNEHGSNSQL